MEFSMVNISGINAIMRLVAENALAQRLLGSALVAVGAYIASKIVWDSIQALVADKVQEHFRKAAYRIFQVIIGVVGLFLILGIWGISPAGLLAGAGFTGIVVGLAARETLGDVISGLLMMFSRPFEIGDWVEVTDYSGIVEDVTIMQTRLETFDGEMVSIPNSVVSSSEISNKSRKGRLRVKKTVGIDYESDPAEARRIAEKVMREHGQIAEDPAPKAVVEELADSSVDIALLFWINDPAPWKRRTTLNDVISTVKERFERAGIDIPFPQREITHRKKGR